MSVQSVMPVLAPSVDAGTETSPCELGPGRGRPRHQVGLGQAEVNRGAQVFHRMVEKPVEISQFPLIKIPKMNVWSGLHR